MIALEICVDDAAGLQAATDGGADRIELCAALALGGLTPSLGMMRLAAAAHLPAMAMIRPRPGDFVWTPAEVAAQIDDIAVARAAGLAGVVIGASLPDGGLDAGTLARLLTAAQGLDVTLHRAIDVAPDIEAAMAICRDLGFRRILTSGGATTALAGLDRLARMQAAAPQITIMPGGGITASNLAALAARVPLTEVHASCSLPQPPPRNPAILAFGFQPPHARRTDTAAVAALRQALDQGAGTRGWTSS